MTIQFTITIEDIQVINGTEYTEAQLQQGLAQVRTLHNQRTGLSLTDAEWLQWAHEQNLAAWYEQGKGADPVKPSLVVPEPAPQPRRIDARRLRLALFNLGLLGTVTGAIAALPQSAQIDWEYATTIREDYPLVVALATNLGLDTDAIFTLASSLA